MAVGGDARASGPCTRRAAARADRRVDRPLVRARARPARDEPAVRVVDADRVRQRLDALVEVEPHERGERSTPLPELRARSSSASRAPSADAGSASASERDGEQPSSSVRLPGERREVAEDRRHVAVGSRGSTETHDERQREARRPQTRARGRNAHAAAGRARRSAPSSRARGAGTPRARRPGVLLVDAGARRRRPRARAAGTAATRGCAASRARGRARRRRRASSSAPTRRGRACGSSSW